MNRHARGEGNMAWYMDGPIVTAWFIIARLGDAFPSCVQQPAY